MLHGENTIPTVRSIIVTLILATAAAMLLLPTWIPKAIGVVVIGVLLSFLRRKPGAGNPTGEQPQKANQATELVEREKVIERHVIERQVLVTHCKYCQELTPVDLSTCKVLRRHASVRWSSVTSCRLRPRARLSASRGPLGLLAFRECSERSSCVDG